LSASDENEKYWMIKMTSPIAVFAYNRPEHLRQTLKSLVSCYGFAVSPVTIFCDGPRTEDDFTAVALVRDIAEEFLGAYSDIRVASENRGLARSIVSGVSDLVKKHGSVIVVEDDLEVAPVFLEYMNESLARYRFDEKVFQISGHMFDVPEFAKKSSQVVLPVITTWGWGTWEKEWAAYDPRATGWQDLLHNHELRRRFNLDGTFDYTTMLEWQVAGKIDSWGIRWYWSVFKANGLAVFPPKSLIRNIGQDGSGTHGSGRLRRLFNKLGKTDGVEWPKEVVLTSGLAEVDPADFRAVKTAIWRQNGAWFGKALDISKRFIR